MNLRGQRFWRSVTLVLSGTAAAQAIPILASLAIARLYAPADFGIYATWLGFLTLASVAVTGRYEVALALEHDGDPRRYGVLGTFLAGAMGTALLLVCLLGAALVYERLAQQWVLLLLGAAGVASFAGSQTLQLWAAADSRFRHLAIMRVSQAASVAAAQITMGAAHPTAVALAGGHVIGLLFGLLFAAWLSPPRLPKGVAISQARGPIRAFLLRHRRLPLIALPADTVNTAATQLPVFIVTARFGAAVGGWLALAMRTLGAPISLLGASVLDVFRRHAASSWRDHGNCRADYRQTFVVLAVGSTVMSVGIALFNEELFVLAFGEEWRRAGVIALWLLPLFALRFVASPLSYVFYVAQKQHVDLLWQCSLLAVTLATLNLAIEYETALISYALGYGLLYIVYLGLSYRFSGGERT